MKLFFSFACDEGFLGAVVMPEGDPREQLEKLTRAHLNPGGEVMIFGIPDDDPLPAGCFLSLADLTALGPVDFLQDFEAPERERLEAMAAVVFEEENPSRPS